MSTELILGYTGWFWSDAVNNRTAFTEAQIEWTQSSTTCAVVERPDHHCVDDLVRRTLWVKKGSSLTSHFQRPIWLCWLHWGSYNAGEPRVSHKCARQSKSELLWTRLTFVSASLEQNIFHEAISLWSSWRYVLISMAVWEKERHCEQLYSVMLPKHTFCWKWDFLHCQLVIFQQPIRSIIIAVGDIFRFTRYASYYTF